MNSGQACRSCRESCSPIPGRGCFGDLSGDEIVVSPPSPIVERLKLLVRFRFVSPRVVIVSRCFLPAIYHRGVRNGACSFFFFFFRQLAPGDAPPCVCLHLPLFNLIAVSLSLLLHFIPLCGALVVLVLAFSSNLGCLALLIYVYGCLSCPARIICGCPGSFRFCFLGFPP